MHSQSLSNHKPAECDKPHVKQNRQAVIKDDLEDWKNEQEELYYCVLEDHGSIKRSRIDSLSQFN